MTNASYCTLYIQEHGVAIVTEKEWNEYIQGLVHAQILESTREEPSLTEGGEEEGEGEGDEEEEEEEEEAKEG